MPWRRSAGWHEQIRCPSSSQCRCRLSVQGRSRSRRIAEVPIRRHRRHRSDHAGHREIRRTTLASSTIAAKARPSCWRPAWFRNEMLDMMPRANCDAGKRRTFRRLCSIAWWPLGGGVGAARWCDTPSLPALVEPRAAGPIAMLAERAFRPALLRGRARVWQAEREPPHPILRRRIGIALRLSAVLSVETPLFACTEQAVCQTQPHTGKAVR